MSKLRSRPPPEPGTIGHVIFTARNNRDWTQNDLSAASGVSQPTISLVERNRLEDVKGETLLKLASTLEIRADAAHAGRLVVAQADKGEAIRELEQRLDATNLQKWISFGQGLLAAQVVTPFRRTAKKGSGKARRR